MCISISAIQFSWIRHLNKFCIHNQRQIITEISKLSANDRKQLKGFYGARKNWTENRIAFNRFQSISVRLKRSIFYMYWIRLKTINKTWNGLKMNFSNNLPLAHNTHTEKTSTQNTHTQSHISYTYTKHTTE